jgi:hypothetical protein
MTEQTRLDCLKAALELRTAGSTTEELLALAERFYRFVQVEAGGAGTKPATDRTREPRSW